MRDDRLRCVLWCQNALYRGLVLAISGQVASLLAHAANAFLQEMDMRRKRAFEALPPEPAASEPNITTLTLKMPGTFVCLY